MTAYASWFYWEFGALPGFSGPMPPRIRWCDRGMTFEPIHQSVTADSVPARATWQSASYPAPYMWRALPPAPPTADSGLACPTRIYLRMDSTHFALYDRSGGP